MKKFLALLLTMAMTLSLTACGQKQQEPAASSTPAASSAAPQEVVLTPAYSVDGFEPVDADGNRVTTGRDTTATYAIATASKYEVSQVGAEILEKGGNAIDAAVAMGFALGVPRSALLTVRRSSWTSVRSLPRPLRWTCM